MFTNPATSNHTCIQLCSSFLKAIFEALEETIYHLRCQLKEKDMELNRVRASLVAEIKKKDRLSQILR